MTATYYPSVLPVPIVPVEESSSPGRFHYDDNDDTANKHNNSYLNEKQLSQLIEQGYSRGFAKSLEMTKQNYAQRIWIIDNSGSMQNNDGHRIVETKHRNNGIKMTPCTRWEEIVQTVNYHIQLSSTINAPTNFRFLNHPGAHVGPQRFGIAEHPERSGYDVQEALTTMKKARPGGCTPLTQHIYDVHQEVSIMAPQLRQSGQRVAIIIATDGLPTDERGYGGQALQQEFVESLRRLEGLPVWVVIRLCTDEEHVVNFYNELDSVLELSVEVLDDFIGEAQEVYEKNPWLNYGLPLHRMREMGYHDRVMDMLDERQLTKSELRDFCALLFSEENFFDGTPDPSLDWPGFLSFIERLLCQEKEQWDPIKKRMRPWINTSYLNYIYGDSSCAIL